MKIFTIKSKNADVELGEIRTDGNRLEFIVDNTEGHLPQIVGDSFELLEKLISTSHHLTLEQSSEPTTHFQRFLLSTGDVVEMTTDGKTALLNHTLLSDKEKDSLMQSIHSGQIKITQKPQEHTEVIPVLPSTKKPPEKKEPEGFGDKLKQAFLKKAKERDRKRSSGNSKYDPEIESANLSGEEDPSMIKKIWYSLKYDK